MNRQSPNDSPIQTGNINNYTTDCILFLPILSFAKELPEDSRQ